MKRLCSILLVIILMASFASVGYAQDPPKKLGRGLVNILTGFWEIPVNVLKTCKSDGAATGLTIGLAKGLVWGVHRTFAGLYEVLTFVIPAPSGYKAITNPPTLLTSETLERKDPALRKDFRPLSSELEKNTSRK